MFKEKWPRRAVIGAVLGILGAVWALLSVVLAGGLIFAAVLGGVGAWFLLALLSWVLPPIVTVISIIASVLMLVSQYKVGGIINVISSLLILILLFLFIAGAISTGHGESLLIILPLIIFFWIGPFILLLTSGVCGLLSG